MHKGEKRQINQPDKILDLYQELGISPQQFPPYTDPSSFSRQFKKCTIYEHNEHVYSALLLFTPINY